MYEIDNERNLADNEAEDSEEEDRSVGDDLETFIKKIKNDEITKDEIDGSYQGFFLLCLLDKEEREKLDKKDADFLHTFADGEWADVPERIWKTTEYKHLKFSKSTASRETFFAYPEI